MADSKMADELDLPLIIAFMLPILLDEQEGPVPQHGNLYFEELMSTPNVNRFRDCVRMNKETFIALLNLLKDYGDLIDSNRSVFISAGEKLMTLIHVLKGHTMRETNERWQHSNDTIHSVVYEVVESLLKIERFLFYPATGDSPLADKIRNDPRYFPFFEKCIGAFDGSHCDVKHKDGIWRNRKDKKSTNVFASANFDMTFQFVLVGWEGKAHDGRVYADALLRGFSRIQGKYHLADAGYALSRYCLTPYRGVR